MPSARTVRDFAPDIVVNAAAYTAVDKAESEPELARAINVAAPGQIAEECARTGALMVHYSTDYVYDGSKPAPYEENDATGPLSVYGQTKLAGDQAIIASGCAHIILRTTWVYDIRGKNFLRTVLRLAREKEELRMVGDQYGAPTWARGWPNRRPSFSPACWSVKRGTRSWQSGLFHLHGVGTQLRGRGSRRPSWKTTKTCSPGRPKPANSAARSRPSAWSKLPPSEYPTPARRPRNSVLSNAQDSGGIRDRAAGLARTVAACHAGCDSLIILGYQLMDSHPPCAAAAHSTPSSRAEPVARTVRYLMNGDL